MGFVQGQKLTAAELGTAFSQCFPAGSVSSYSATLLSSSTQAAWFTALGLPAGQAGAANGVATLDENGHLQAAQFNTALIATYLLSLPTTLPATSGQLWLDGGVLSVS